MSDYISSLSAVSAACTLTRDEELAILTSDACVCDPDHPEMRSIAPPLSTSEVVLLYNRLLMLREGTAPPLIELSKRETNFCAFLNLE